MFPVVADADALFGATTRGLLIHLDYQGLIRLHWSPLILDEMSRALVDTGQYGFLPFRLLDCLSIGWHSGLERTTALP